MSIAVACAPPTAGLTIDRKNLLAALERAQAVVPARCFKPIFGGVRLSARDGSLHLQATDGEIGLNAEITAEGTLPPVVVPCQELIRRLRASKQPTAALAVRGRPQKLILNGGRVEHNLYTLPLDDFPPVPDQWTGQKLVIAAQELHDALAVTSRAMAQDQSRYSLNGVLLESDDAGVRLVATDGRRLALANVQPFESKFQGQVLLPARLVKLVAKFAVDEQIPLVVAVKPNVAENGDKLPADLFVAGPCWTLSTQELEGRFPLYRDIMPVTASRFAVDRRLLVSTLREVMLATSAHAKCIDVSLRPRSLELSASSAELGSASARLPAKFLGGGDSLIHTGFNPGYLLEAANSLASEQIIIDVSQNGCGADGKVFGKPALLYGLGEDRVRWVVMPVTMDWPATREYLGSNFKEELAHAG